MSNLDILLTAYKSLNGCIMRTLTKLLMVNYIDVKVHFGFNLAFQIMPNLGGKIK